MRKTLALLLTLAMLVTGFSTFGVFAEDETVAPVEISSAKDFVDKLTANPTGSFVLTNHINFADYNGDGITDTDESIVNGVKLYTTNYIIPQFNGTLDGDGHKIYGFGFNWDTVTGDCGIIQYVAVGANTVIRDIEIGAVGQEIDMTMDTTAYATIGGLSAAQNSKSYTLEVTNVNMYINLQVNSTAKLNMGGFFGATQNCVINNSELHGTVSGATTGAWVNVAGFSANPKNVLGTFNKCRNYANISVAETSATSRAGGFIGYTGFNVDMNDCINYGDIKSAEVEGKTSYPAYVGSMISNSYYAGTNMSNCANFGEVHSSGYAGGMIGLIGKKFGDLTNCINFGKVTSDVTTQASPIFNEEGNGLLTNIGNIDKSDAFEEYDVSNNVKFVGVQQSATADNLFNVRFLGVVDELTYASVGYEIAAYSIENGVLKEWSWIHDTQKVYTAVKGTDKSGNPFEKSAENLGGDYIFALATTKVPAVESNGNVVFIVKPFAKTATETVYGQAAVCTYNTGACLAVDYIN